MALDQAFTLKFCESVAGGHETDAMDAREFALGIDQFARLQLAVFNLFPNGVLDPPIRGKGVSINVGAPHCLQHTSC
jgi:hypothetical protein